MTKRVMLLGASGQMGQALRAETLPSDWDLRGYSHAECDITDHRVVQKTVHDLRPDLIINAAAMTAVDACEKDIDGAAAANFEGPANLAAQCAALDVPLIHLSTDYVFDGRDGEKPYQPYDQMSPLSTYGATKMMGEEAIRHAHAFHVILRISSVFSAFGANILTKTLQWIDQRDELKLVTDQKSCPTYAPDAAKTILAIGTAILKGSATGFGTFHYCNTPPATRFEFAQAVMDAYAPFTARRPKILPAVSADFPGLAERPAWSVLDCEKTKALYGIPQKPWREGLNEAVQALIKRS
jgi:dTDP-4-dehydrorhamnose reductase